jgi:kynurenine formamidase
VNKYFDLSQPVEPGMTIFPGDPQPVVQPAEGVTAPWRVTDLHLGTHSGTHIDSASHYLPAGKTIDQYPIERFILPGIVLPLADLSEDQSISAESLSGVLKNFPEGGAILVQTQWDRYWKTDRYLRHPYLSPGAIKLLIRAHASLVGIDALNVDSTVQSTTHAHRSLMENDILIVENLTHLSEIQPGRIYLFSFLPINLPGLDGSPIRAVAW